MGRQGFRKAFGDCNLMARSKGGYQEIYGNRDSMIWLSQCYCILSFNGRQSMCDFM
jgi:hypothetical protein